MQCSKAAAIELRVGISIDSPASELTFGFVRVSSGLPGNHKI
jgi:hypothetical protein